jgi:hypothetical protein
MYGCERLGQQPVEVAAYDGDQSGLAEGFRLEGLLAPAVTEVDGPFRWGAVLLDLLGGERQPVPVQR